MPVFVNGKFCAQRTTGVQRYARCALAALDARLAASVPRPSWTLLLPPGAEAPVLRAIDARHVPWGGPGGLHGWEQLALPRAARQGVLLNLAGSAPAWDLETQVCVMHDAAAFDQPQAYTRAFVTWYRWLFRRLARRPTTRLVTVSAFSRERLAAALGLPLERFTIASGGAQHFDDVVADATLLMAKGLDRQTFVLAVGSHNPTKNLSRLVEAWGLLGRADLRLAVVGGSNDRVFEASGAALQALDGVIHLGPVDDATLKALYERALAFVFPSLYEGFGLPPLEAMACGCPVAASTAPAVREACGDAAVYFDPLLPQEIAGALRRLIDDPDLCCAVRDRGRERVTHFRWDATAQSLLGTVEAAQ